MAALLTIEASTDCDPTAYYRLLTTDYSLLTTDYSLTMLAQDQFVRDHIEPADTLVVRVGGH